MNNLLESRIEIIQIRLVKSHFNLHDKSGVSLTGDSVTVAVSLRNNGEFSDGGRQANFIQSLKTLVTEDQPFTMDIEFAAVFHLDPPPLPLAWPNYVSQVFPRMVFPHLRYYVADLTRRSGFSPLNLNQNLFGEDEPYLLGTIQGDSKWMH